MEREAPYQALQEQHVTAPEPAGAAEVQPDAATGAPPALLAEWLAALNPAQRDAATHTAGPLAIVAGPGTGKTRTLTVRIAHLVRGAGRGAGPRSWRSRLPTRRPASCASA